MALSLNRNWLLLGAALALGGLAVFLSNKLIQDRISSLEAEARAGKKMVPVVVAKVDLDKGATLSADNLAVREVPQEYAHKSALRPAEFDRVAGQRLGFPLRRGEALLDSHTESSTAVFSTTLPVGRRALTFEVDEVNSISGLLRPGDRIDLILTAKPGGGLAEERTQTLLSNVEVLATGQVVRKRSADEAEKTFSTVTLSLVPQDAQRIVVAKGAGRLTAVLRNPDDAAPSNLAAMTVQDLLAQRPASGPAPARRGVQYIVGSGAGAGAM